MSMLTFAALLRKTVAGMVTEGRAMVLCSSIQGYIFRFKQAIAPSQRKKFLTWKKKQAILSGNSWKKTCPKVRDVTVCRCIPVFRLSPTCIFI